MITISNDLIIRKNEADNYIDYLKKIENLEHPEKESFLSIFSDVNILSLTTCAKASIFLILYNTIESTITGCLNKIHSEIIGENLKYCDLNENIKK